MNNVSKDELVKQYEEVAISLLMSEYAEQEGQRLLREYEKAKKDDALPKVPQALDTKCRAMIQEAYERDCRQKRIKKLMRTVGRVAAMLFITLGVCTTLVFSVEALRTPVINFMIEKTEWFTAIDFDKEMTDASMRDTAPITSEDMSPLASFIPTGYELDKYIVKEDGTVFIIYNSENGSSIFFSTTVLAGNLIFDTEDADAKEIEIAGYEGLWVEKDSIFKITWVDTEKSVVYQLRANGLNYTEVWAMAESIARADLGGKLCAEE